MDGAGWALLREPKRFGWVADPFRSLGCPQTWRIRFALIL
jgi:hypothetical protein